ncbi:SoxR reducing system RseC family protein [uncultured Desulfobacter sp.]|uniref:SoxR reducing system RseC family protein n=1 Tax=uncultured Desulfobacter sp. TaxID=240139 RepID=UPI0029F4EF63|nr:SoxR reducing system RseC family protein [uncultured Desulfobacter sp.]
MITEDGIVTHATPEKAWIKTTRSAACESCSSKDSCGVSHHPSEEMTIIVPNTLNVLKGDRVIVGIDSGPMLFLSFFLYVFPIILLIIGALIGDTLAPVLKMDSSALSMGFGFLLFAVAFFIIRRKQAGMSKKDKYKPFLVRKKAPLSS